MPLREEGVRDRRATRGHCHTPIVAARQTHTSFSDSHPSGSRRRASSGVTFVTSDSQASHSFSHTLLRAGDAAPAPPPPLPPSRLANAVGATGAAAASGRASTSGDACSFPSVASRSTTCAGVRGRPSQPCAVRMSHSDASRRCGQIHDLNSASKYSRNVVQIATMGAPPSPAAAAADLVFNVHSLMSSIAITTSEIVGNVCDCIVLNHTSRRSRKTVIAVIEGRNGRRSFSAVSQAAFFFVSCASVSGQGRESVGIVSVGMRTVCSGDG